MLEHDSNILFATTKNILGLFFTCFDSYVDQTQK